MLLPLQRLLLATAAAGAVSAAAEAAPALQDPQLSSPAHLLDGRDFAQGEVEVGEGFIRFPVHATRRDRGPLDSETGDQRRRRRGGSSSSLEEVLIEARQTAEVSLTNLQDGTIYSIALGLGTPAQPVEVIIDTGSSELWVNPQCATSNSRRFCDQFPKYTPGRSSSVRDASATGFIQYGKGNVTLRYVADSITVGSKLASFLVSLDSVVPPCHFCVCETVPCRGD
jgi:hypothetical protein